MGNVKTFTVKKLADIAGVSVRTLHYYDQAGLLKPDRRGANGYRHYGEKAALQLQQILFFREIGFSLKDIKKIMSRPDFNVMEALEDQRNLLLKKDERLQELINTVEKTIGKMKKQSAMKIWEYYSGFNDEEIEKYREEVRKRWGEKTLADSEKRVIDLGKDKFIKLQAQGGNIFKTIMENMSKGYDDEFIQQQIGEWRRWLENFHHYTDEEVVELGREYSRNPEFIRFFNQYGDGLPVFLTRAIEHHYFHK